MKPERFRPVVDRPTNIEIFKKLLAGAAMTRRLALVQTSARHLDAAGRATFHGRSTSVSGPARRRSALPSRAKSGRHCFITTDPPVWQSLSDVAVAAHI
jgi:hypothetical protein